MTCDAARLWSGWGLLCLTLVVTGALADLYYDEDMLMQDLYSRLAQLEEDYNYIPDTADADDRARGWNPDNDIIPLDSRGSDRPDIDEIRDHEYLEHGSNNDGWQKISGGAGEGQQHLRPDGTQNNTAEVKSDETLPFYCHPPNPCPKGYSAKHGCQERVQDTATAQKNWIEGMQNKGMCACDTEHMFECPDEGNTVSQESDEETRDALNMVLGDFLQGYKEPSPYSNGLKRNTLVAKKSPIVKRSVNNNNAAAAELDLDRYAQRKRANNPYLGGPKLRVVAKKGLQYQHLDQ